jgi:hypothetical protein
MVAAPGRMSFMKVSTGVSSGFASRRRAPDPVVAARMSSPSIPSFIRDCVSLSTHNTFVTDMSDSRANRRCSDSSMPSSSMVFMAALTMAGVISARGRW